MEDDVKRYRVRPKQYLCLSPEEAVSTGITVGEETVEEFTLVRSQGFGYRMYASVREISEEELQQIPVSERREKLFENRREAARYIAENNVDGTLYLYAVQDIKSVDRSAIGRFENAPSSGGFMEELKTFEKKR